MFCPTISGRRLSRELICDSMLSPQSWDNTWIFIDSPDKNESRSSEFPIRSMDVLIHLYTSNWLSEKSDKFDRFILSFLINDKNGIKEPKENCPEIGNPEFGKNLISTNNPENPYEVEFRHNAYGDVNGHLADGLVAFKLDQLLDTEGETVKLKLIWNSYSGQKSHEFDYCTRQSTPANPEMTSVRAKNFIN